MQTVTLTLEDHLIETGRRQADVRGVPVEQYLGEILRANIGKRPRPPLEELIKLIEKTAAHSGPEGWTREDAYDES